MKRILDGRFYDTAACRLLLEWDNGRYNNDFNHCEERLYLAPDGCFLLHGEGGARSEYARPVPGGTAGGQRLRLMSREEALMWAERRELDPSKGSDVALLLQEENTVRLCNYEAGQLLAECRALLGSFLDLTQGAVEAMAAQVRGGRAREMAFRENLSHALEVYDTISLGLGRPIWQLEETP